MPRGWGVALGAPTPSPKYAWNKGVADSHCASLVSLSSALRKVSGIVVDLLTGLSLGCCSSIDALREVPGLADIVDSRVVPQGSSHFS